MLHFPDVYETFVTGNFFDASIFAFLLRWDVVDKVVEAEAEAEAVVVILVPHHLVHYLQKRYFLSPLIFGGQSWKIDSVGNDQNLKDELKSTTEKCFFDGFLTNFSRINYRFLWMHVFSNLVVSNTAQWPSKPRGLERCIFIINALSTLPLMAWILCILASNM